MARVYVGGVSSRIDYRDIEDKFGRYGRIRDIALKNGYAFIEFDDYRDAEDAVYELNGRDLAGSRMQVYFLRLLYRLCFLKKTHTHKHLFFIHFVWSFVFV